MGKVKLSFDPLIIIFAFVFAFLGQGILLANYFAVLFLHEYAHAYVAKNLGYEIKNMRVSPFGICLNMDKSVMLAKDEIKIALAGPVMNLILAVCCFALWWGFPVTYNYLYMFCFANVITAVINFLPAYPLDGGRVMMAVINSYKSRNSSARICMAINIIIAACLAALFIISLNFGVNITYLFMGVFILLGAFNKNSKYNYDYLTYKNLKSKTKGVKVKSIVVNKNTPLFKLISYTNYTHFLQFVVLDDNGEVLTVFYETELEKLCEKFEPTVPVFEAAARRTA